MRVQPINHRYRGRREPEKLVEQTKAASADILSGMVRLYNAYNTYKQHALDLIPQINAHLGTIQAVRSVIEYFTYDRR